MAPLPIRYFIGAEGKLEEHPHGDLVKFRDHAESVQEERDFKIALYLDRIKKLEVELIRATPIKEKQSELLPKKS